MAKFYKTTIAVEVLSEEQLGDFLSLEAVAYAINEGNCVGRTNVTNEKEMTSKEMADALYEFGSDPSFFGLKDNGSNQD